MLNIALRCRQAKAYGTGVVDRAMSCSVAACIRFGGLCPGSSVQADFDQPERLTLVAQCQGPIERSRGAVGLVGEVCSIQGRGPSPDGVLWQTDGANELVFRVKASIAIEIGEGEELFLPVG